MMNKNLSAVIASGAKQSIQQHVALWIASSQVLLAMTAETMTNITIRNSQEDRP
jgi:hypothetical protein